MSLFNYHASRVLSAEDPPFAALIMAAIRKADTTNVAKLKAAFPEIYAELNERYNAPAGLLPGETPPQLGDDDEDREPTDDELANRHGVEGGIGYSTMDTRDEHDESL